MAGRNPARFLAPIALVAVVFALFMVVNSSLQDSGGGNTPSQTSTQPNASPAAKKGKARRAKRQLRRYTVRSGDTPSSIADKTGVPLDEILRLNPDLDPQTLSPGQRIKLRQ